MNDFKLDYTDPKPVSKKQKRFLIIIGTIVIASGIVYLPLYIIAQEDPGLMKILFPGVSNILIGLLILLQAYHHKILFQKKYFLVTPDFIEYKLGRFYKLRRIEWDSIEKITLKKNSILYSVNNQKIKLSMIHFPSNDEKKLKSVLTAIASDKGKITE